MFQNISEQIEQDDIEDNIDNKKGNWKIIIKNMVKPQNILLYIIAILISTVSIMNGQAPFGLAILAASISNGTVAFPVFIATIIGTIIGFGKEGTLSYLLNAFVFLGLILLIKPKRHIESRNERQKIGKHLVTAIFLVQAFQIFSASFTVGKVLETILNCTIVYIFYKIFVNSMPVIKELGKSKVFTAEEAIGASLLMAIAICAINPISIYGFSIRNILCILLVITLAWRNGLLIGTTAGVTLSVVLNLIGFGEPILIAVYAVSGMIAGILGRIGKLGLVITIVTGIVAITLIDEIAYLNYIKEVIISAIFLLVFPKNININVEDIIGKTKLLPVTRENRLGENKEAICKLNSMSQTIDEIAKSYEEAAATVVDGQEENKEKNREIFIEDLKFNLEAISENMLYEDIVETENGIASDIFEVLVKKGEIEREDLIKIFENHNSYIMGVEDQEIERQTEKEIYQVVKNINYTYQVSKVNFIWKQKVSQNNKIVSEQLSNVSKVINNMAKEMTTTKEEAEKSKKAKFKLSIGTSKTTKNQSTMSGDCSTQMKLTDGKYLLAISDGMGTGEKARRSSKKAINMLENLLESGFNKEESIKLINSALNTNIEDDMYATLDISILDLNTGNVEFVKNGACPTYIKTKRKSTNSKRKLITSRNGKQSTISII